MPKFMHVGGKNGSRYRFDGGNMYGTGVDPHKLDLLVRQHLKGIPCDMFCEFTDRLQMYVRDFMVPKGTSKDPRWKKFKAAVESL